MGHSGTRVWTPLRQSINATLKPLASLPFQRKWASWALAYLDDSSLFPGIPCRWLPQQALALQNMVLWSLKYAASSLTPKMQSSLCKSHGRQGHIITILPLVFSHYLMYQYLNTLNILQLCLIGQTLFHSSPNSSPSSSPIPVAPHLHPEANGSFGQVMAPTCVFVLEVRTANKIISHPPISGGSPSHCVLLNA